MSKPVLPEPFQLCPCGSGRTFGRCCLQKEGALEQVLEGYREAMDFIIADLTEFASDVFGSLADFAWSDFEFGKPTRPVDPENDDFPLFIAYFLYKWRPGQTPALAEFEKLKTHLEAATKSAKKKSTAKKKKAPEAHAQPFTLPTGDATIADAYMRVVGDQMNQYESNVVRFGILEPFSFYEIVQTTPGEEMWVKEILTGNKTLVKERLASKMVQPNDILYAQLFPIGEVAMMSVGGRYLLGPRQKPDIIMLRQDLQREAKRKELMRNDLMRFQPEIRKCYLYLRDVLTSPPKLETTDGEAWVPHTVTYDVPSAQAAFDALAPLAWGTTKDDLLKMGEPRYNADGSIYKIRIPWQKPGNARMKDWDSTLLGEIVITGRKLEAQVNSAERVAMLRQEIESRLGGAALHKETRVEPIDFSQLKGQPDDLVVDAKPMRVPGKSRVSPRPKSQEQLLEDPEIREAMRRMVQKQVDGWAEEKIPALGNRTPLQAVKDPDGREMVTAMLLEYERMIQSGFPESVRPSLDKVWRKLKLPHPGKS